MPQSYTKLTYHCTFSTKDRVAVLFEDMRPRLHGYMARMINSDFGFAHEVGGAEDHVHILCDLRPTVAVSEVMRQVKAISSGWMHREFAELAGVTWQRGYGAFTVSASAVPSVRRYIREQERHHREFGFREEFRRLLERHGVEFDERYLF
jgi:REP element-mobilizing transposase RayT